MNAYYYFRCDERLYISIFMLRFTLHQLTDLQVLTNIYYLIFVKGIHISRLPMGIFFIGDLRPKYQLLIKKILFHHKIK